MNRHMLDTFIYYHLEPPGLLGVCAALAGRGGPGAAEETEISDDVKEPELGSRAKMSREGGALLSSSPRHTFLTGKVPRGQKMEAAASGKPTVCRALQLV